MVKNEHNKNGHIKFPISAHFGQKLLFFNAKVTNLKESVGNNSIYTNVNPNLKSWNYNAKLAFKH